LKTLFTTFQNHKPIDYLRILTQLYFDAVQAKYLNFQHKIAKIGIFLLYNTLSPLKRVPKYPNSVTTSPLLMFKDNYFKIIACCKKTSKQTNINLSPSFAEKMQN